MNVYYFPDLPSRDAYFAANPGLLAPGVWSGTQHSPSWIGYDLACWMADGVKAQWFPAPAVSFGAGPS
jgi:hypothetical protein